MSPHNANSSKNQSMLTPLSFGLGKVFAPHCTAPKREVRNNQLLTNVIATQPAPLAQRHPPTRVCLCHPTPKIIQGSLLLQEYANLRATKFLAQLARFPKGLVEHLSLISILSSRFHTPPYDAMNATMSSCLGFQSRCLARVNPSLRSHAPRK